MTTKKGNTDKKKDKSNATSPPPAEPPKEPESGDNSTNADEKPPEPPPEPPPFKLEVADDVIDLVMKRVNKKVKKNYVGPNRGEDKFNKDHHIKKALVNLKMNNIEFILNNIQVILDECIEIKKVNNEKKKVKPWQDERRGKKCKYFGENLPIFLKDSSTLEKAKELIERYDFNEFEDLLEEMGKDFVSEIFGVKKNRKDPSPRNIQHAKYIHQWASETTQLK